MSAHPPIRLGFIGAGFMGQHAHLDVYAHLPGVELVALAEGRPNLAQLVAERYGILEICATHQDLLARAEVDAVVSVMGFDSNWGAAGDVLRGGRHLLTEKAICLTEASAAELAGLSRQSGKIYQLGYMKRFDPAVQAARSYIAARRADGARGELLHARIWCAQGDWQWGIPPPLTTGESLPDYPTLLEPRPEDVSDDEFRWVKSWLNYYSHQTNLLRYLLDEDYEPEYYRHTDHADLVLVRTSSGIPAFLEFPHFRVNGWDEGCQVFFQRGTLTLALPAPLARQQSGKLRIDETGEGGGVSEPHFAPQWSFEAQARAFIAAVKGEGPEFSPPEEAAKDVRLAHQLVRMRRGAR